MKKRGQLGSRRGRTKGKKRTLRDRTASKKERDISTGAIRHRSARRAHLEILEEKDVVLQRERVEHVESELFSRQELAFSSTSSTRSNHLLAQSQRISHELLQPLSEHFPLLGGLILPVDDGGSDRSITKVGA